MPDELTNQEVSEINEWSQRGSLEDRYEIYLAFTDEEFPLTFQEWLEN